MADRQPPGLSVDVVSELTALLRMTEYMAARLPAGLGNPIRLSLLLDELAEEFVREIEEAKREQGA